MNNSATTSNQKNYNFTSIRVKEKTKVEVNKFLEKINKAEDCGKVTFDTLVNFFLERMNKEEIEALQMKTITWSHEEKRLRKIWEKKKGKISDNQWKEMLFLGQLSDFIASHSRLRSALDA